MTIQDVIDNDLIQDIRTGTASDDSVEMIDFPGAVMPNFEYSKFGNTSPGKSIISVESSAAVPVLISWIKSLSITS